MLNLFYLSFHLKSGVKRFCKSFHLKSGRKTILQIVSFEIRRKTILQIVLSTGQFDPQQKVNHLFFVIGKAVGIEFFRNGRVFDLLFFVLFQIPLQSRISRSKSFKQTGLKAVPECKNCIFARLCGPVPGAKMQFLHSSANFSIY